MVCGYRHEDNWSIGEPYNELIGEGNCLPDVWESKSGRAIGCPSSLGVSAAAEEGHLLSRCMSTLWCLHSTIASRHILCTISLLWTAHGCTVIKWPNSPFSSASVCFHIVGAHLFHQMCVSGYFPSCVGFIVNGLLFL